MQDLNAEFVLEIDGAPRKGWRGPRLAHGDVRLAGALCALIGVAPSAQRAYQLEAEVESARRTREATAA